MTRARSAPKKSRRFPRLNFRRGRSANSPYSGNAKRSAPNAMRKLPSRPGRNGMWQERATPAIPTCGARAFQFWKAYGRHGTVLCLSRFWMSQTICKACNASTLMGASVSSLAARSQTAGSSFRVSRKSPLPFAKALPLAQASILPLAGLSMWPFPQVTLHQLPRAQKNSFQTAQSSFAATMTKLGARKARKRPELQIHSLCFPNLSAGTALISTTFIRVKALR